MTAAFDVELPLGIARASREVQAHYAKMIEDGQTPMFAEMCALQAPPGTKGTDRAFQEGRLDGNWLDKLPKYQAMRMVREAKAAGIDISGRYYMGGLADKRGHRDPSAWISDTGDIKRVAKERNLNVSGIVNVEGHQEAPIKRDLNPRIAKKLAKQEMANSPGLSMQDAMAKVKDKHVPHWKKKRK